MSPAAPILAFLLPAFALGSNGTAALTWEACDGPVAKSTTAPEISSLLVSVSGATQPIMAYQFRVIFGDAHSLVPDAWRFDFPVGCQAQNFVELHTEPWGAIAGACPAWPDTSAPIFIADLNFTPIDEPYATTTMRFWIAKTWTSQELTPAPDPAARYFLGAARFNHRYSVGGPTVEGTCGGYDTPMCFKLIRATWLDASLNEYSFSGGGQTITFNDPTNGGSCAGTPVQPTTWGQIRSQYRH